MTWSSLPPILTAALVAIAGWFVVNLLNARRERATQRRVRRVEFLLDAYRRLERAAMAPDPKDHWTDLETAIADIQLLGSAAQVKQSEEVARALAGHGAASTDDLLRLLRDDLRLELDLDPVAHKPVFLRFAPGNDVHRAPAQPERVVDRSPPRTPA